MDSGKNLTFLSSDELDAVPHDVQRKIIDYISEQQAQMGSLEPIENVRRRVMQVDNHNRTLQTELKKFEARCRSLETQLNETNENKSRLQSEINALKEQATVVSQSSDWQQELHSLRAEKSDLSSHVVRCNKDAQRLIATISELKSDKNLLAIKHAEKEAQFEHISMELTQARESNSHLDLVNMHLRTEATNEAARADEAVLNFQTAIQSHVEEVNALKREVGTFQQQADDANRSRIQSAEQVRVVQEKHAVLLQQIEDLRRQLTEKQVQFNGLSDRQAEQTRSAVYLVAEKQHRVTMLEATVTQLEHAMAGCEEEQKLEFERFVALEQNYRQQLETLQAKLADSEKCAELSKRIVSANDAGVEQQCNILREYQTKCTELRLIRQENDALLGKIRVLSERGIAEWPLAEKKSLREVLSDNGVMKIIFDELAERCSQLDADNGELFKCRCQNEIEIRDFKKRLEAAEFARSCLSQQVRYLVCCVEKLQGADVSFEAEDASFSSDLTEEQRNAIDALQSAVGGGGVVVGLKQQSIDEIRRHYVRYSNVRELQVGNLKLIEAIYQLEANDVLRGGNVADLYRELTQLRTVQANCESRAEEMQRQFAVVVRERDVYRHLCTPQIATMIRPLLMTNDNGNSSLLRVADILSSPKITDIFAKFNQLKRQADVAEVEESAMGNLLKIQLNHNDVLQRDFNADRERWQKQLEQLRLDCRNELLSSQRYAAQIVSLETERDMRMVELQTYTARANEVERKLAILHEQNLASMSDMRQLRADKQSLELSVANVKTENQQLKNELDFEVRQEADANAKYAAAKARLQALLPLQRQLDDLRAEKTWAVEALQASTAHVATLNRNLSESQTRIGALETANDMLKLQLATDVDAQKAILSTRNVELQATQKQLSALQAEMKKLRTLYDALLAQHEISLEFHDEYQNLTNTNDQLSHMNRMLNDQLAEFSNKLNATSVELTAEKSERVRLTEEFSKRLDESNMGSQSVTTALKRMQAEKNQVARQLAQREATVQQMTLTSTEQKQQIDGLTTQFQQAQTRLADQATKIDTLESQVTQLTTGVNARDISLQQFSAALNSANDECSAERDALAQVNSHLQAEQKKWTELEAGYLVQLGRLRRDLDESRRTTNDLRSHAVDGDGAAATQLLKNSLRDADKTIAVFESELADFRAKYAVLQGRYNDVDRQLRELKQQQRTNIASSMDGSTVPMPSSSLSSADAQQQVQNLRALNDAQQRRLNTLSQDLENVREAAERQQEETESAHQTALLELASQNDKALAIMQQQRLKELDRLRNEFNAAARSSSTQREDREQQQQQRQPAPPNVEAESSKSGRRFATAKATTQSTEAFQKQGFHAASTTRSESATETAEVRPLPTRTDQPQMELGNRITSKVDQPSVFDVQHRQQSAFEPASRKRVIYESDSQTSAGGEPSTAGAAAASSRLSVSTSSFGADNAKRAKMNADSNIPVEKSQFIPPATSSVVADTESTNIDPRKLVIGTFQQASQRSQQPNRSRFDASLTASSSFAAMSQPAIAATEQQHTSFAAAATQQPAFYHASRDQKPVRLIRPSIVPPAHSSAPVAAVEQPVVAVRGNNVHAVSAVAESDAPMSSLAEASADVDAPLDSDGEDEEEGQEDSDGSDEEDGDDDAEEGDSSAVADDDDDSDIEMIGEHVVNVPSQQQSSQEQLSSQQVRSQAARQQEDAGEEDEEDDDESGSGEDDENSEDVGSSDDGSEQNEEAGEQEESPK